MLGWFARRLFYSAFLAGLVVFPLLARDSYGLEASALIQFAGSPGQSLSEAICTVSLEVSVKPSFAAAAKQRGYSLLRSLPRRVPARGSQKKLYARLLLDCQRAGEPMTMSHEISRVRTLQQSRMTVHRIFKFLSLRLTSSKIALGSKLKITGASSSPFKVTLFEGCARSDSEYCEIEQASKIRILFGVSDAAPVQKPTPTATSTPTPAPTPLGKRSIIVAQGYMGRTTISCDDGKSWVANRSWDIEGDEMVCGRKEPVRCFDGPCWIKNTSGGCSYSEKCDCGHSPAFGKGLAYGNGTFVANFGWGAPGKVMTSKDGVAWTTSRQHSYADYGGLDFGAGTFVLATRSPLVSSDGINWLPGGSADFRDSNNTIVWSVRSFKFLNYLNGRFVAVAEGPGRDMLISKDAGASWARPTTLPTDCAVGMGSYGSIAFGNNVAVAIAPDGKVCRSTDGGDTWSVSIFASNPTYSHTVWNGDQFVTWSNWFDGYYRYTSPDGLQWTKQKMLTEVNITAVMVSDQGTYIATNDYWKGHETQQFLRSQDGLTWEVVPAGSFVPGHAILNFSQGLADGSDVCPGT